MPWKVNMYINSVEEFERILEKKVFFECLCQILASNNECSLFTHDDRGFSQNPTFGQEDTEIIPLVLSTPGFPFNSLKAGVSSPMASPVLRTLGPF